MGTVHELAGLPADGPRPLVLTPALARELPIGVGPAVLTVGSERHVGELASAGLHPPVIVKLASPMRRYGVAPDDLPGLLAAVDRAGLPVHGFAVHPPLAGSSDDHVEAIRRWLPALPADALVYASHLDAAGYAAVRAGGGDEHAVADPARHRAVARRQVVAPPDGRRPRRPPGARRRPRRLSGRPRAGRRLTGHGHRGDGARRAPARRAA